MASLNKQNCHKDLLCYALIALTGDRTLRYYLLIFIHAQDIYGQEAQADVSHHGHKYFTI